MIENFSTLFSNYGIAIVICAVIGYLLGSISFAILTTNHYTKEDIRKFGSGNAGMTNVMRSVGKRAGIITFAGDFLKGAVSCLLGMLVFAIFQANGDFSVLFNDIGVDYKYGGYIAGVFCIIGHMFPIYHQFKGGKGAATAVSIFAVLDWRVLLAIAVVFFLTMFIFKTISISTISSAICLPIFQFLMIYFFEFGKETHAAFDNYFYLIFCTAVAFLIGFGVILKHHENIKRILNGTEKKFTVKKSGEN